MATTTAMKISIATCIVVVVAVVTVVTVVFVGGGGAGGGAGVSGGSGDSRVKSKQHIIQQQSSFSFLHCSFCIQINVLICV